MKRKNSVLYVSIMATLLTTTVVTMPLYAKDITEEPKTITTAETEDVYLGKATEAGDNAVGNELTISTPGSVTGNVYAGYASSGDATGNTLTVDTTGTITGNMTGGFSHYGAASGNTATVNNQTSTAWQTIYGGLSGINADPYGWKYDKVEQSDYNKITLNDLSQAYAAAYTADNNTVSVSGLVESKLTDRYTPRWIVYGGHAAGYTEVKFDGKTDETVTVPVTLTAQASGNTVTVADSTVYEIYGGMAEGNLFTYDGFDNDHITISPQLIIHTDGNTVNVTNSTVAGYLYGGHNWIPEDYGTNSYTTHPDKVTFLTADGNTVYLENSQVELVIYGGLAIDQYYIYTQWIPSPLQGEANGNTVTLVNTAAESGVYGGYIEGMGVFYDDSLTMDERAAIMKPSSANNNTVTIDYQLDTQNSSSEIAGGYTTYGDANGNKVSMTGKILDTGTDAQANWSLGGFSTYKGIVHEFTRNIAGSYTEGGSANDNQVSVKNVAILGSVVGGYADTYDAFVLDTAGALSQSCNNNTVAVEDVYGFSKEGNSTIHGGWVEMDGEYGPFVPSDKTTAQMQLSATGNTVTMQGDAATPTISTVDGVYGGRVQGSISIAVPTTATDTRSYTGTYASDDNTVALTDYQSGYVLGGAIEMSLDAESEKSDEAAGTPGTVTLTATGTANDNKVSLFGSTITSSVLGGAAVVNTTVDDALSNAGITFKRTHSDTAQGNTVALVKTKVTDNVIGGLALQGTAAANTVTMGTDSQATSLYGGVSSYGKATGNTVNLAGGTVTSVYGGATGVLGTGSDLQNSLTDVITTLADVSAAITAPDVSQSDANGNTVNYYGGTVTDSIIGGQSDSAAASDNVVNLYAALVGENLNLYGGIGQTESTGNTLNVYAKGNSVANLDHFQNYNFYVPADTVAGDTVLTVTDTANLTNATVKAGVEETMNLSEGQVINLISGTNDLQDTGATYAMMDGKDIVTDAGFVQRKASIWKQDDKTVVIGIRKGTQPTLNPDTKLFAEDRAAAVNLVNTGSDFAATAAYDGALTVWNGDAATKGDFTPYLVVGGHDLRADTGSYVDTYGLNANLGFVKRTSQKGHTDTLMPFLEYGNGNYTSHLDNGARGDGDQRYIGAGLLARRDLASGIHYEAMVRAGRTNGDFHGQIANHLASYDTSAPYVSAMLGAGKIVKKDKASIDYYGKVFWTHLGSDSVQMHSDLGTSQYDFDNVDSYRTRLGFRWTKDVSPTMSYYAGLAWNYEFGDNGEARYGTFDTLAAGVKGSSGMLELGWQSKIDKDHDWGADLHITGWTGVQRGVTYSATVSRAF